MKRRLEDIISGIIPTTIHGSLEAEIEGISFDAFTVRPGELFMAVEGVNSDRHQYIPSVIDKGIRAVVHSKPILELRDGVTYIRVENVQRSMSPVSAAFFGYPSKKLFVIGVTGTNGKSTTCSFIYQLIKLFSRKAGIISSVYLDVGGGLEENRVHQSTPEAPVLQRKLLEAVESGVEFMVVEATSHGLAERNNRVGDVEFDAAIVTNVTHEHLEFHGTMERYIDDKANLFRLMSRSGGENSFGIVNNDDPNASVFIDASTKPVYTYGIDKPADFRAVDVSTRPASSSFTLAHPGGRSIAQLPLPGRFNVSNGLAAALTVSKALSIEPDAVLERLKSLTPIRGRMNRIERGQPFEVIVDFAHTPDSFSKLLPEVKSQTDGKLIVVFGSAGERDTVKRPIQGELAARYADIILLADEDPRGEDPMNVLEEIAAGCHGHNRDSTLFLIPDRKRAIQKAIEMAHPGDAVLLLGKGHETTIAYSDGDITWDEVRIAGECLEAAGYR